MKRLIRNLRGFRERPKPSLRIGLWGKMVVRVLVTGLIMLAGYVTFVWSRLPEVAHLSESNPKETAYREYFSQAYPIPEAMKPPAWTAASDLHPLLFKTLVHTEDNRFYQHEGVDWKTTRGATRRWLRGKPSGGGSTITQQLARNLYLHPRQTPHRKFTEILLALRIEREVPKERILELYANVVEYGQGVWGITYAADHYFDTLPADLTPFETIFLCSLLPAPRAELKGANLERSFKVQKRASQNLFLEEAISAKTFDQIRLRQTRLRKELEAGIPLHEALAMSRLDPATGSGSTEQAE